MRSSSFGCSLTPLKKDSNFLVIQTQISLVVRHLPFLRSLTSSDSITEVLAIREKMDKGVHIGSWGQLQGKPLTPTLLPTPCSLLDRMEGRYGLPYGHPPPPFAPNWALPRLLAHQLQRKRAEHSGQLHARRGYRRDDDEPHPPREWHRARCGRGLGEGLARCVLGTAR